jgi:branched-chain amino acid transport system substrate-binding protein
LWDSQSKIERIKLMTNEIGRPGSLHLKGKTITIGAAAPLSGRASALGREMLQAIQLAVDECNEKGGISGALVELDLADDAGKVEKGEAVARTLCAKTSVLGVIGHYNSDVTVAASLIYEANDMAMISPIVSNPGLTERGLTNIFRFTNRDDQTGLAIARYLHDELGKTTALIAATTTTYGRSMANEFTTAFENLGGMIVDEIWFEEGTEDFESIVRRIPANSDHVFYGGTFEGAPLLRSLRATGNNHLFATGDGCWDVTNFLRPAGAAVSVGEGVLVLSATPELGRVEGSMAFAERYTKRYGAISNYAVNSYASTKVLLAAIEDATTAQGISPQRESIAPAVRTGSLCGIAYSTATRWDDQGDNTSAVTALHTATSNGYQQVAQFPRTDAE